jgi:tetratricopeptide (TPR) repeat protein
MKTINQSRIFISYSHQGRGPEWKALLLRHLGVFERHQLLDVWQDGKIRVSSHWDDDIRQAMNNAGLAVVLLTPEALESQYILETEFPFLCDRQHRDKLPVFPLICEPCDWKCYDWLRATQAPNESNPIAPLTKAEQDKILRQLATDIATELSRVALTELPKFHQPPLSENIYLEKFPLTRGPGLREEKLIGREQEIALLDLAFAQPHTAIVSLVAWGGVGKTMLVQHWLQRLQREGWFGAQRVYAWSFYSQGTKEDRQASEDNFLAHALEWFGVQCEPTLSPWDKGRLLADAVARERTLLILDGIEPLQYPPGPMGGQLRAPGVQSLLKHLARKANNGEQRALCLVTTREPLTDLADFQRREGSPWGSVLRVDLGNLTNEAGAALLHHAGAKLAGAAEIKPDDKELLAASREVDGHALTLNLLGRFIARAHGGDIRQRDLVKFEEADRKEQGGTTFKMLAAFENWFANEGDIEARALTILRLLGLFDRPADAGCLAALRTPPVIAGLTEPLFTLKHDSKTGQVTEQPLSDKAWNDATYFLSDFGLVVMQVDDGTGGSLLDCHPLIREYFGTRTHERAAESWLVAHRRLYEYLQISAAHQPDTLEGLQPLYHAVAHGCKAKLHEQVCYYVYLDRIVRDTNSFYSVKILGAFSDDLSAVANFFDRPWNLLCPTLSLNAQMSLLATTAFHLQALGRFEEAIQPMRESFRLFEQHCDAQQMVIITNNLADLELTVGNIAAALRYGEHVASLAKHCLPLLKQIAWRARYASILHQSGRRKDALNEFQRSEKDYAAVSPFGLLYSVQGFCYCDCLLDEAESAAWRFLLETQQHLRVEPAEKQPMRTLLETCAEVERRIRKTLNEAARGGQPLDIALDCLTAGRTALIYCILQHFATSPLENKIGSFAAHALDAFRASGQQDELPRGLLLHSWWSFLTGKTTRSLTDLDEAWDIAERGPMRLHMADIHLYRARLFFREKPYPWKSPQDDLAAAEKLINECGYHRRDEELADAKRVILGS